MLINLSNHPISQWEPAQVKAAEEYGEFLDLPFPSVDARLDSMEIEELARKYLKRIKCLLAGKTGNNAVHLMGELSFTFSLACMLCREDITCIVSTSERQALVENGLKLARFEFIRFREFKMP